MDVPCVAGHGIVEDELRIDGARVVAVRHAPGLTIHRHAHDTAKLVVLVEGGATERIGLELVDHARYELVARAPFCSHENQYHAGGARSILVELERVPAGMLAPEAARVHGRRLAAAFRMSRGELRRAIAGAIDAFVPARTTPSWLEHARELLHAQLTAPPSLDELAAIVGVHPVHLAQAFRRRWHVTPLGYVRAHRVFRAVERIAHGVPLGRVAAETGFADQSHMTRAIRRARQASPGALRALTAP